MKKNYIPFRARLSRPCILLLFSVCSISLPTNASTFTTIHSAYAQETLLSIDMKNKPLRDVFSYIEKNSEFIFFYSKQNIDVNKRVSITAKDKPIVAILDQLFKGMGITYQINDRQISLRSTKPSSDKGIMVNGAILDEQQNPLPGVSIKVKGTNIGTITDVDGNYFLEVPDKKSVLVYSFIGFDSQEIPVNNQININVNMKETSTDLNEVVVVGYGAQKRASVVGSISTVNPEDLQRSPTSGVSNALAGQLAGVIAVQRSGEPGSNGSNFWIRGISSFTGAGTSPLVLVDGIERTLDDMDPSEIESFSVLKDAAASAVYGVRGANGVILVNTKRGKMGKPTVNLRYEQMFTSPTKTPDYIGSVDYLEFMNDLYKDFDGTTLFTPELIDKYRNHIDNDLYPDINWLKEITNNYASNSRVNLNISGGNERLRYAIVATFLTERGIIARDDSYDWDSSIRLRKYNIRSNVDLDITKTTLLRVNIGGFLRQKNSSPTDTGTLYTYALETVPYAYPPIYSNGEIPVTQGRRNPWAIATQTGFIKSTGSKIESTFTLEQDFKFLLPGLKLKGTFAFDRYQGNTISKTKNPSYYNPATGRDEKGNLLTTIQSYGDSFLKVGRSADYGNSRTYLEGQISYIQDFGKHHVDGMFLYNENEYDDGSSQPYRYQGIAGRASYSFDSRYFVEFNFGYNGTENFIRGRRFGFFPSGAIGWLLSEEPFMESLRSTFSKIKFKGSIGLVGNSNLPGRRFAYMSTINDGANGYTFGLPGSYYNYGGIMEGEYGVPSMTWEKVRKINVGMEVGLWNELELQIDLFKEHRYDIYMKRNTIPTAAGLATIPFANFGKTNNQGIDLSLQYNKQINKSWRTSFRGTFTYAKNKITEMDEPPGVLGTYRSRTGYSVGQLFGLIDEGLYTKDDFNDDGSMKKGLPIPNFSTDIRPGDIKYKDMNGDGQIDEEDQAAIGGTYDPQIVYGFGGSIGYKDFDLSLFFQGNGRTYTVLGGSYFFPGSNAGVTGNILSNYQDRWTVDNPSQDVFWPRLRPTEHLNNQLASTWWVRNMSLLRLKDIELGYRLPKVLTRRLGVENLRFYARGTNLFTFSSFKMWDPEQATTNGVSYPIMKSISLGFDINF